MKKARIISIVMTIAMILSILPMATPALASPTPSEWAVAEMNDANTSGLLTAGASRDFHRSLTRDEFCELVVLMVERTLGRSLPVPSTNPFVDDVEPISVHALKAWNYGIILGVTTTRFAPSDPVLREQLCAMMIRAIRGMERDLNRSLLSPGIDTLPYRDAAQIRPYAVESVRLAYTNGIMHGDTAGNFNPRSNISSQECVAVIIRSFNRIESLVAAGMTTPQLLDKAENRVHIGFAHGDTINGVTRNVTLPLTTTGGATVSWSTTNSNVISISGATGIVNAGATPQSVRLTATITLNNVTRTKTFDLMTSPYSGDRLIIENALAALDIVYTNQGDNANSVTGRIGLPTRVLGVPVTWHSSNPAVVSNTGIVNVPPGNETRSAVLTATLTLGSLTRTKVFNLTVVNPANAGVGTGVGDGAATLHGVSLGMSPTQVTSLLGSVRRTISASSTESWQLYHNANHSNFIAVAFINNRAVAVYSMASGVSNQLRGSGGSVITVAQANALSGINAISFTDPGDASAVYAIMIYDSTSVIGSSRTLSAEGQEQLLFELVNAYRVSHGRSLLTWSARLGDPARVHSSNRGEGNLRQRVTSGTNSFDDNRYSGGDTVSGVNDAFGALNRIIGTSSMRTQILQSNITVIGTGFSGGQAGADRTFFTYALGNLVAITGVTARLEGATSNVTTVNVATGATVNVTLTMTPTSFNETFTVTSSNTARMTITNVTTSSTGATIRVNGIAGGDANIVITGNSSGRTHNVAVNVGAATAATGLALHHLDVNGVLLSNATNVNRGLYMAAGAPGVTVVAVTTPAAASNNVNWTATGNARVNGTTSVNNQSSVTITSAGAISGTSTVRATIPGTTVSVTFVVAFGTPLTLTPTSTETNRIAITAGGPTVTVAASGGLSGHRLTWTPDSARVTATNAGVITAPAAATAGNAFVTVRSSFDNMAGGIEGRVFLDVQAAAVVIPPTGVTITNLPSGNAVDIDFATETSLRNWTLGATVAGPAGVNQAVTWSCTGDAGSINANTGVITFTGSGTITVTVTTVATPAVTNTVTITVRDTPTVLP